MVEDDMILGDDLKQNMENILQTGTFLNPIPSKQWPMVVIKDIDFSLAKTNDTQNDLSVFPPSSHENLFPSHFNSDSDPQKDPFPSPSQSPSSSPTSPLSPSSSSSSSSSSQPSNFQFQPSDCHSPPLPQSLSIIPTWWGFAFQILRSKIVNLGSYFVAAAAGGKGRVSWPLQNLSLVMVVVWWLSRRWRRRRESVGHLLQIITEKDEKIIQLLNQIAQMNELLLAGHRALASRNG